MKTQSGHSSLPALLLTFSLLLLVLAIGFVFGRVVVARAYLDSAPKFETDQADLAEVPDVGSGPAESPVPGRVYVPPPAPPPTPPDGEPLLPGTEEAEGSETASEQPAEPAVTTPEAPKPPAPPVTRTESQPSRTDPPPPRPPEPKPQPRPQPAPPPPEPSVTYSLQVGVFTSVQGARQVVDELARAGYPARTVPEKRGAQELYRVVTGRYRTEYAARKALDQLREDGFDAFLVQE
ncbi:MAG: SPOR domain-containing protein [Armatimonadetes bacterium]|nr:SPOR domain-containing protein [Armatimonadota bacterium]